MKKPMLNCMQKVKMYYKKPKMSYEKPKFNPKLKAAAKIQFSQDQPSIIYYGTEIGISQNKSMWNIPAYGDLQARQPMNWKIQDKNLLKFYKELIAQKKN